MLEMISTISGVVLFLSSSGVESVDLLLFRGVLAGVLGAELHESEGSDSSELSVANLATPVHFDGVLPWSLTKLSFVWFLKPLVSGCA